MSRRAGLFLTVSLLGSVAMTLGCSAPASQGEAPAPAPQAEAPKSEAQAEPQRYDLKGKVVSIDKAGLMVTVDHEAIEGFMGAMTMAYPVKEAKLLDNLAAGQQVTAKVVSGGTGYWLEDIAVVAPAAPAVPGAAGK